MGETSVPLALIAQASLDEVVTFRGKKFLWNGAYFVRWEGEVGRGPWAMFDDVVTLWLR